MCRAIEELIEQQVFEENKQNIIALLDEGVSVETIAKSFRLSINEVKAILEPAMV